MSMGSKTSEQDTPFKNAYTRALKEYVFTEEGEEGLMCAYELGRRAVAEQMNILDLVTMHQNIVWKAVLSGVEVERMEAYLRRSEEFLAEVMAPFEMMHRGFNDTIRQLQETNATLEQRVEERTRALRESQRNTADLARLYLILSSINSAIVRLQDREALFTEACRIAVNQGGYPVAWISMRNSGKPVSGDTWCHLAGGGSNCQSTPVGPISEEVSSSIDRVYAEGVPVVRHRDEENPVTWKEFAGGFPAYGLLPLEVDGRVGGVFVLFSAEPDAFKPEEMRLLTEMAGDLSFALEHIQKGEQLNYLAYYDLLTGLPNRSLLMKQLQLQLQAAERKGMIVVLLLVDLVHFSDVSDTYGRHIGDQLLKQIAERFGESRECETVAKLGAERFALSFTDTNEPDLVARILEQEVFSTFARPFVVDDTEIHIAVKVGISLFPADAGDAETLFKNAEIALKRAHRKDEPYLLYDAAMNDRIIQSVTMQAKLRKAIERGALDVHYQPKVSAANGRLMGLEALLRYSDPESGLVMPGGFIPLLEETGMIIVIGDWVMRRAAEDLYKWRRMKLNPPRVAVNVSPIQLRQKNFIPSLRQILQDTDGYSDGLDMEITESAVMTEVKKNIPKLEAVREMGFHIAIDDFGTGYSSLSYLSQLPVNALKIDRSFIVEMTERPNSMAIVTSIITLAHSLGLEVVAEGVELEEQAKMLRLLRCELLQGNLYSRPLPADEIVHLFNRDRITEARSQKPEDS